MKIIKVVPISRGIGVEELSYYTSKDILPGYLVEVPVRNRAVPALVVSTNNAEHLKSLVKKSEFQLKKIGKILSRHSFTPAFLEAAKKSAEYFVCSSGSAIEQVSPKTALSFTPKTIPQRKLFGSGFERFTFQALKQHRFDRYRSLVREYFAKSESVLIVFPTAVHAEEGSNILQKGIEDSTYILSSKLSKKNLEKQWKDVVRDKHPVLIVITPGVLSVPRSDIGMIIIEEESSRHYKKQSRPYIDTRVFARFLAETSNAKFILSDTVLRVETVKKIESDDLIPIEKITKNYRTNTTVEIVNMINRDGDNSERQAFKIIGKELRELIEYVTKRNERVFCFVVRRGMGSNTVCQDCGKTALCDRCSTPVVLHEKNKDRIFICNVCGKSRTALERCLKCDSWRLATYGIGTDNLKNEIEQKFPDTPITLINKDHTSTNKKVLATLDRWLEGGGVCVGTEMALPYVYKHLTHSAIVSLDSLFSIPDFHIREQIFNLITSLRLQSKKTLIIQTRFPNERVLNDAVNGKVANFQKEELEERRELFYPPFSRLIKLEFEGSPAKIKNAEKMLKSVFEKYNIDIFPALVSTVRGKKHAIGLIVVESQNWPDNELIDRLRDLPQEISVNVDPINTL